eukprot:934575-Rhodomonas_salina.1
MGAGTAPVTKETVMGPMNIMSTAQNLPHCDRGSVPPYPASQHAIVGGRHRREAHREERKT